MSEQLWEFENRLNAIDGEQKRRDDEQWRRKKVAEIERKDRARAEQRAREREAEARRADAELKEYHRRKFSAYGTPMTEADFEQWWKQNRLRLKEELVRERESANAALSEYNQI